MTVWRILGLGLLAAGVVLLVLGLQASGSFGEEVRREMTGEYSDRTVWYLVLGVAGVVIGGGLALFGGQVGKSR